MTTKTNFETMRQTLLLLFLALILMPDTINALPFKEISTDNGLSNRRVQESILDDNGIYGLPPGLGLTDTMESFLCIILYQYLLRMR